MKKSYHKALVIIHPDKVRQKFGGDMDKVFVADKVFDQVRDAFKAFSEKEHVTDAREDPAFSRASQKLEARDTLMSEKDSGGRATERFFEYDAPIESKIPPTGAGPLL